MLEFTSAETVDTKGHTLQKEKEREKRRERKNTKTTDAQKMSFERYPSRAYLPAISKPLMIYSTPIPPFFPEERKLHLFISQIKC